MEYNLSLERPCVVLLLVVVSARKHPQLCVLSALKSVPETIHSWPQSHKHFHFTGFDFNLSTEQSSLSTRSLPNLIPVKSIKREPCVCLCSLFSIVKSPVKNFIEQRAVFLVVTATKKRERPFIRLNVREVFLPSIADVSEISGVLQESCLKVPYNSPVFEFF